LTTVDANVDAIRARSTQPYLKQTLGRGGQCCQNCHDRRVLLSVLDEQKRLIDTAMTLLSEGCDLFERWAAEENMDTFSEHAIAWDDRIHTLQTEMQND